MKFAILGLLVVLLIGFFVVVWKAAKDWRWYNIVAVCVTMLLAIAFLFPTAGVLKSRAAWHQLKEKLEVQAAAVEVDNRQIKYGDPSNPEAGKGVVVLDQRLAKLGIEAGRRWRNLQLQTVVNNVITLKGAAAAPQVDGIPATPPAVDPAAADPAAAGDPAAALAAAAPTSLIPESLVVYGFAETRNQQQLVLPTFYLGEFRVTASTPTEVTLAPTGPLEQNQMQAINSRQAVSWSLYELLPLDGHQPFIAAGSVPGDDNFLGRVDEDLVKQLLDGNEVLPETLQDYVRDGSRATQDDVPLSRWTKIEFDKNYAIEVDSPDSRGALDGGFFDGNGRAVDSRLQHGEDGQVRFRKGDQVTLKEEAAALIINEGVAHLVDRYYLRPLNDYRFVLRRIRLRLAELSSQMTELAYDKSQLEQAIEKTNGMLVVNRDIKLKLEEDLAQFQVEKKAIAEYTSKKQAEVKELRSEMIRLHRENIALAAKLEEKHRAIELRLDGLTLAP
jgi:hypothetical protein